MESKKILAWDLFVFSAQLLYFLTTMTYNIIKKVQKTIKQHKMLCAGQSVLIGVSGGADSVALLLVLESLAEDNKWKLAIAHVNHGLRGKQADADADFVSGLARKLDLPYYIAKPDVAGKSRKNKIGIEEAGRRERYAFFHKIARIHGYDKIAVGHHKDDSAEQILLNLIRGTGPEGLGGISPVKGIVIRPLTQILRTEIETFLKEKQICWQEDASNKDNGFTRNRVRNQLIPELKTFNPRITQTLCRLGEVMQEENIWARQLLEPVFKQAVLSKNPEKIVLCVKTLADQPRAAKRRVLKKAIEEIRGGPGGIELKHVDQILSIVNPAGGPARQIHLPGRILAVSDGNQLVLTKEKSPLRSDHLCGNNQKIPVFSYQIEADKLQEQTTSVWIEEINARICFKYFYNYDSINSFKNKNKIAFMDFDRLTFPLTIRNVYPGDRFTPLGMRGSMKVSDFFINMKIPRSRRRYIPVIQSPDGIVWIGGFRIDQSVRVTDQTKKLLKIEIS